MADRKRRLACNRIGSRARCHLGLLLPAVFFLVSCFPAVLSEASVPLPTIQAAAEIPAVDPTRPAPTPVSDPAVTSKPRTPTPVPTTTPSPTPAASPTPLPSPTPVLAMQTAAPESIIPCSQRIPSDKDLLTFITKTYGISREYEPKDLVPLDNYFDFAITLGYPTFTRAILISPLQKMIAAMKAEDLQPQIISSYRSYAEQAVAFQKWVDQFPDRANLLSAPPGHSEHQLGTVIDFGSPNLKDYIEEENLQFHTYFFKTPEGTWLLKHAHEFGFVLSYTRENQDLTGFAYEPWHFRYVGVETAAMLRESGLTLIEYQLQNQPEPCRPDTGR